MASLFEQRPVRTEDIAAHQRGALRRYRSWRRFHHGPRKNPPLLASLDRYPDCVLVAGCQRSGTTMLARIIAGSRGFRALQLTHDDELDAALALAGQIDLPADARYCFQTTYLNEQHTEYAALGAGQRLIWVVRNPYSVIHSMVYNWKRFALAELYAGCGAPDSPRPLQEWRPWRWGPSRIHMACHAYRGKSLQILNIRNSVPDAQLLIVEYDELVRSPRGWLPRIFDFIREPYEDAYAANIRSGSLRKAEHLKPSERKLIDAIAAPAYRESLGLVSR